MLEKNWRDLIKPKALDVDKETLTSYYGKFIAKPLERGFGITLGNALRRVLLSSLQGVAISHVRFDGVVHEFTSIHDVKEDVAEIILNLKEVRFQIYAPEATLRIDKKGPGVLKASDILTTDVVSVLNQDFVLATLGVGAHLKAELMVTRGRGYVPAEQNKRDDLPMGWIPIDSFFSPIRKVNYTVTQSRVGQKTDYDKLTFEVWTDGCVLPEEAIALGSKILKDQLSVFLNFEEEPEPVLMVKDEQTQQFNPNLYRSVEELELSVRSANCLQNANIRYIYELVLRSETEMLKTKNFGRKSLNEIKEILTDMGLSLGMKLEGFVPPPGVGISPETAELLSGHKNSDLQNSDESELDDNIDHHDHEHLEDEESNLDH